MLQTSSSRSVCASTGCSPGKLDSEKTVWVVEAPTAHTVIRCGVGDESFANLGIDIIAIAAHRIADVPADDDTVGGLVEIRWVHQHAHRHRRLVDVRRRALVVGADVP